MKTLGKTLSLFTRLGISASVLLFSQQAMADGADTNYGTTVRNTATVDYNVGGNPQPTETSGEVTFDVDRLVVFEVVANQAARTATTLGASGVGAGSLNYVEYSVTNLTNGPLDLNLAVLQSGGDDFDMLNTRIEIDDGNGDADFTGGDYITALGENDSILVRIYADTPATGPGDTDISDLSLVASGAASPGVDLTAGGVWDPDVVQNVFGDTDEDNSEAAESGFVLGAPVVNVTKVPTVVSDPFGSTPPKAVPGSIMQYAITIDNSGGDDASDISISDVIDLNIELVEQVAGSTTITITDDALATTTCIAEINGTDGNGDGCVYYPAAVVGPPAIAARTLVVAGMDSTGPLVPLTVPAGETWSVSFQVEIQ